MASSRSAAVSLCMIVRNEERQLADCLAPVAELFDEIIIVDTGSSDATKEAAARFTPHVFDFAWCDDFAAARNEALRRASGDWIFWLDADDRLTPENVDRLRQLFDLLDHRRGAYLMETVCPSQYACEGTRVISHTRLFRRDPRVAWQGRVHEQLRPELASLDYEVAWSNVQIQHTGYLDPATEQRKLNRDLRLLRMDYAVDPDNVSMLVHLGLVYFRLCNWSMARRFLERVLAMADAPSDYLRQVYAALAHVAQREGDQVAALSILNRAVAAFPDDDYLLYLQADCLYELDQYAAAKAPLNRILAGGERYQYRGGVPGDIKHRLAPVKLADVLRLERQYVPAAQLLRAVLQGFPDDTHAWHMLGRVYLDSGQRVKLLSVVERLRSCPQGDVFGLILAGLWHLTHHEFPAAETVIDELIAKAPQMPLPRLLRVEWLTQSGGAIPARIRACRDALRVQPGNLEVRNLLDRLQAVQQAATAQPSPSTTSVVIGAGLPNGVALA